MVQENEDEDLEHVKKMRKRLKKKKTIFVPKTIMQEWSIILYS